jgi:uncharacterized protein YndB with AHSA1/START domain
MTEMGALAGDGARRSVRFERRLDADVEDVWQALVEPERLGRWLAEATIDARVGGNVELRFGDEPGGLVTGSIRVFDPPRVLEYDWTYPGESESVIRFELTPSGSGTTLVVDHRLLGADAAAGYGAGWHAHLDQLAEELAGGVETAWQARFEELLSLYQS